MVVIKDALTMSYEQEVSGTDRTLQSFDFLIQTLESMVTDPDIDRMLLCQLLITTAQSKQFDRELNQLGRLSPLNLPNKV